VGCVGRGRPFGYFSNDVKTVVLLGRKPECDETPTYLELASICSRFSVLPNDGGVLDQDQLVMRKLMIVYSAWDEKQEKEKPKGK